MSSSPRWLAVWALTLAIIGAMLAVLTVKARRADAEASRSLAVFAALARDARELEQRQTARVEHDGAASAMRPPRPIAAAVSDALTACGLPASTLSSLSPESESLEHAGNAGAAGAERVRLHRRRATLVLTPITLPQLGRFLMTWRQRSPEWTIARLDVEPRPPHDRGITPGADLPLRVVLGLESLSIESARANRRP